MKPQAVDLFAGAGGATAGNQQAGFRVIGAVEIDPDACASYRLNHPATRLWEKDIRRVNPRELMSSLGLQAGQLDLLGACPPCQGFSRLRTLNKANSVADERNALANEFVRFARTLQPKALMLENVPSLLEDPMLARLRSRLTRLGYETSVRVLDASWYGVPQRRRRMILLGSRSGEPRFPPLARKQRTVRDAIGHLAPPGTSGDPLHDIPENRTARVMAVIRAVPRDGGSRRDIPLELVLPCHRRTDGFFDVFGRMSWDACAPTITSGCNNPSKGRFLHPVRDGAITLREAALLQTFPRRYRFSLHRGKETVAAQIGNALPPELIKRLALSLARQFQ